MQIEIPAFIQKLNQIFPADCELNLVGGCVRDSLLGLIPKDYDLVTNLLPDEIEDLLEAYNIPSDSIGKAFGIIFATIDQNCVEIATYRNDIDGSRNTRISFSNRDEDAARRDFTINQIYYDLRSNQIIDKFGGMKDLNDKILRCVGDANKRFEEDQLRVYRAYRFANKYKLSFDNDLKQAIENIQFSFISRERIVNELQKTFETLGHIPFGKSAMQPIFDFMFGENVICYSSERDSDPFVNFILNLPRNLKTPEKLKEYGFSDNFSNLCVALKRIGANDKEFIAKIASKEVNIVNNFANKKYAMRYARRSECVYKFITFNPDVPNGSVLKDSGLSGTEIGKAISDSIIEQWEAHHE